MADGRAAFDDPAPGPEPAAADIALRERYLIHLLAVFDAVRTSKLEKGLKGVGLSVPKDRALGWLTAAPGSSMTALARGTYIDRTTLTRAVDQLEADGHVRREPSVDDRRKVLLWLTPSGQEQVRLGAAVTDTVNKTVAGALDAATIEMMSVGLLHLLRASITDREVRYILTGRTPLPTIPPK